MKKIISYILIVITIVQLFAPFTIGIGAKNDLEIKKNYTEAEVTKREQYVPTVAPARDPFATDKTISLNLNIKISPNGDNSGLTLGDTGLKLRVTLKDASGKVIGKPQEKAFGNLNEVSSFQPVFIDLTPDTDYFLSMDIVIMADNKVMQELSPGQVMHTNKSLVTKFTSQGPLEGATKPPTSGLPSCPVNFWDHVGGCIGQALYYAIFVPTSLVFGLSGKILDVTIMYSISDGSYRSAFVTEGWGIVRDFCNMFFIFVLLYIAFGTILSLHGVKTKEMIINVVIIGLLINFSLFATQVIIDASNILTRVFYNQKTILTGTKQKDDSGKDIIGEDGKPVINSELGTFKEIKLSEAIVSKVDPQQLIIHAKEVSAIPTKGPASTESSTDGITPGSFIVVVLLASIVNIVGTIAFITSGIIFIARVLGLWIAMILSPLAFFSYIVPSLKGIKMIGWEKWWPDTLKLAFLAPVFAFFMYLIVGFMDKGLGIMDAVNKPVGLAFLVSIILPFVFIMVLLMKAKDIAKDMSGEMGQQITNGIKAAGGIALGGAALGGALVGRKIIGAGIARASRSEDSMHRATEKIAFNEKLDNWKKGDRSTPKPTWEQHAADNNVKGDLFTKLGGKLNEKQMKIGKIDHARHEMDKVKKDAGLEGVDDENLSGVNEKKMKDTFAKNKRSEFESNVKKGTDGKDEIIMTDTNGDTYHGEEEFKSRNRAELVDAAKLRGETVSGGTTGELTDEAKKKVENELNIKLNEAVKITTDNLLAQKFDHLQTESRQQIGGIERAISRTNTGTWDVRKISDAKVDSRESFLTKIPVGLTAAIAMGVRGGIKNIGLSNGSVKIEGNFMKDLGNTISDSLKGMKVNVDLGHVGETKSSADAHGGGGGGHH